jgi:thioesterase domain-containing protein
LRSGDSGQTPLVLIHATPGDVLGYANLATELPSSLPCLGLVSKGLHLPDEAHGSIEEMATAYIDALRPRLDGHPWILGGWCYGGIVAYEMARQLVAAGEPAPFVILIEAFAETPADPSQAKRLKLAKLGALLKMPLKSKISYLRQRFAGNETPATPAEPADEGFSRSVIYQANMRAIRRYSPRSYGGELQVLLSDEDDGGVPVKHGGWHLLGARCVTHRITGGHHLALRPPHVSMLAATIAALLESRRSN